MIKLATNILLIPKPEGDFEILSLEGLKDDLDIACNETGYKEAGLADILLQTVAEYFTLNKEQSCGQVVQSVEELIVRILMESNLVDIAAKFCLKRKISPNIEDEKENFLTFELLKNILKNDEFFDNKSVDIVVQEMQNKLPKIKPAGITESLITSWAKNLYQNSDTTISLQNEIRNTTGSGFFIHPSYEGFLGDFKNYKFLNAGIINLSLICVFSPSVNLVVDMNKFTEEINELSIMEFEFFPPFYNLCLELEQIIGGVEVFIQEKIKGDFGRPSQIDFCYNSTMIKHEEKFPPLLKFLKAQRMELQKIVDSRIKNVRIKFLIK